MTGDEKRMVFLQRLEEPVSVQNGGKEIRLIYCGVSYSMEELNPY